MWVRRQVSATIRSDSMGLRMWLGRTIRQLEGLSCESRTVVKPRSCILKSDAIPFRIRS